LAIRLGRYDDPALGDHPTLPLLRGLPDVELVDGPGQRLDHQGVDRTTLPFCNALQPVVETLVDPGNELSHVRDDSAFPSSAITTEVTLSAGTDTTTWSTTGSGGLDER
jgi:hypothetical protein